MKVLKFGGASIKSPESIKNLLEIIKQYSKDNFIIVLSAMGKNTNLLERLCYAYFHHLPDTATLFNEFKEFHLQIVKALFKEQATIYTNMNRWFSTLERILSEEPSLSYDFEYDRIVSFGELLSTSIISDYLATHGIKNNFTDIRKLLITDANYRNANIDNKLSEKLITEHFTFSKNNIYVTQGFIAGTRTNQTTTLGREGSDYTAALLANFLNAQEVTIWKDVPGVMSADPKLYKDAITIREMSYREAVELSHFGAKVIHPKTIKPLENKQIPLHVRSFLSPDSPGSTIKEFNEKIYLPPIYIHKSEQLLLTLTPRDFSFIAEEKLSHIFSILAKYRLKLNLMQNSAISFSFCIDDNPALFEPFIKELQQQYEVRYNKHVELITIRHYTEEDIHKIIGTRQTFVEQRSRLTARFVLADPHLE